MAGQLDDQLVYQKRLRRRLHEYQKNVPPQVRAARMADDINAKLGRPLQYQYRGTIEYVITVNGPEPKEYSKSPIDYQHYIDKQLKPVADAILPFIGNNLMSLLRLNWDCFRSVSTLYKLDEITTIQRFTVKPTLYREWVFISHRV